MISCKVDAPSSWCSNANYMGGIGKDKFGEEMKKNSRLASVNVGFNINFSGCLQPTLVTRHNNSFHRLKTKSRVCDLCWMKAFLVYNLVTRVLPICMKGLLR
ncbi:hypothetical protein JHK87_012007 [Glycine soja]|nr:hypothetical protein JHK87_012007 [Glycine soja]